MTKLSESSAMTPCEAVMTQIRSTAVKEQTRCLVVS
jgi:hypothetical protein